MTVPNTLAYYGKVLFTAVKSFTVQVIGVDIVKPFMTIIIRCHSKLVCLTLPSQILG